MTRQSGKYFRYQRISPCDTPSDGEKKRGWRRVGGPDPRWVEKSRERLRWNGIKPGKAANELRLCVRRTYSTDKNINTSMECRVSHRVEERFSGGEAAYIRERPWREKRGGGRWAEGVRRGGGGLRSGMNSNVKTKAPPAQGYKWRVFATALF